MLREQRNVTDAIPQRRHLDEHDVDAVVEILPEIARSHEPLQRLVAREDDPNVHGHRITGSNRLEPPLLQDAQQLQLHAG